MIFKTSDDGSLTNIFKEYSKLQNVFDSLSKETTRSVIKAFNNTSLSVEDLDKKFGGLDTSVKTYLGSVKKGQASMSGLKANIDASSKSMGFATIKAKALSVALNALTGLAITAAIKGITWLFDQLITTLDEQKEKLDEAVTSYKESTSELESLNGELKTTVERIDELNGKEHLTFTEKDELERLKQTNDELERKIFLLEKANQEAEKEVVDESQNLYNKYTNGRTMDLVGQIDFYTDSSLLEGVNWDNFKDDLSWLVAQYHNQEELLANAQANGWTSLEEKAKDNLKLLEGYMSEASGEYTNLYETISGISDVSITPELEAAKTDLNEMLDIVAEILGYGGQVKETDFDSIWSSDDFKTYKEELIELSKTGELKPEVLSSNENYKRLLEETGNTADETAEHINALVDDMFNVEGSTNESGISNLGISETIDKLNTQLKPVFSSLKSAYQDIFTDDGFKLNEIDVTSTLSSIKSELDKMSVEYKLDVDYSAYEELAKVLYDTESTAEDVDKAFDDFATSIALVSGTENLEVLKSALEDLGIQTMSVVDATTGEIQQLDIEKMSVEQLSEAISLLNLQKVLTGKTSITTQGECAEIIALANAAQIGTAYLIQLEKIMSLITERDSAKKSGDYDSVNLLNARIKYFSNNLLSELDLSDVTVDYGKLGKGASSAGKDAGEEYKEALEDELSSLDSVIDHVTDAIDKNIDSLEKQKDAAISALESERDAILESIENEIEIREDKIDGIDDEINALERARREREQNLALQKDEYELARMLNQQSILQYSEEKGMHYVTDTSGARDAREEVQSAKDDIAISKLEREKELLEDEIEIFEKRKEEIEKSYEAQISAMEKMYDALIANMEASKDKFTQLKEVMETAEISAKLKQLGIDEQALINGSEEEFNKLKDVYMNVVNQLNSGNADIQNALSTLEGTDLSNLGTTADTVGKNLKTVADNSGEASQKLTDMKTATDGMGENISGIGSAISTLDPTNVQNMAEAFSLMATAIERVNEVLGAESGINFEEAIASFGSLQSAVEAVSSAISGGSTKGQNLPSGGAPTLQGSMTPSGSPESGESGGITGALDAMTAKVDEVIGSGGESKEGESGGSGVVGKFGQFKTSVDDVSKAIGVSGEGEEGSGGEEESVALVPTIEHMGEVGVEVNNNLQTEFQETLDLVSQLIVKVKELAATLEEVGSSGGSGGGSGVSITGNAGANGTTGNAFARGKRGSLSKDTNALVGELGQEMVVRDGRFFTVGDNGAEMVHLKKDDIVFNASQTADLLKNGKTHSRGKAFANGTSTTVDKGHVETIRLGNKWYTLEEFNDLSERFAQAIGVINPPMKQYTKQLEEQARMISNVTSNNQRTQTVTQNISVTMPNVTDNSSAERIVKDIQSIGLKKLQMKF